MKSSGVPTHTEIRNSFRVKLDCRNYPYGTSLRANLRTRDIEIQRSVRFDLCVPLDDALHKTREPVPKFAPRNHHYLPV